MLLVEAGPRVLLTYTPPISGKALARLRKMGVEVLLGKKVVDLDETGVWLAPTSAEPGAGTERILSRTLVWAAGVAASPIARTLGAPLDRAGRMLVGPDLSVPGAPGVQVIGDLMSIAGPGDKPVPGVAQAAVQSGEHAAKNILRALRGEAPLPFRYLDKGSLATIGRAAAVAEIGGLRTEGLFAWLVWVLIHILTLIDFRSRIVVLVEWAYAWLRFERGARLITGEVGPLLEQGPPATTTVQSPGPQKPPAPGEAG